MRIINITHSSESIAHRVQSKINSISICLAILLSIFLCGCGQKDELGLARECVGKSQIYYQHSVERYKKLITAGKDLNRLHFELGRLYYEHGNFDLAKSELQKTDYPAAQKLLAISLYRLGNFTDALDIFDKAKIQEDEFLFYFGATAEKLNLFDRALDVYRQIKGKDFKDKANTRIQIITKEANLTNIKELDPGAYQIITSAPDAKKYPQAGALILSCDESIEVTADGQQVASLHYLVKILNERGKEDFSETQIGYDSTFEKVELEYARTIKPDGTVVDVGSRHIRDVSKYLNFPLYSNARIFIISFPEIAEGAVIEYKAKIYTNQLVDKKNFYTAYSLQSRDPIIAAKFDISLPKDKPLGIKIINSQYNNFGAVLNPVKEESGGRLIYRWAFKNIPQIVPESNMPPQVLINPTVLVSTFNSWQDIYDWWWKLAREKITADNAIKNQVALLIKGAKSEAEKARVIYNFCAQKIRYVAVEYGQAGYEPHAASDIFRNKYGDCKDQSILLVTMLKEAGLNASPVLIATDEYYNLNEDFPVVLFNHCIAAILLKDKLIFMDPTAETCSFGDLPSGDQSRRVLVCKADGYKIQETPLFSSDDNFVVQELKIQVNPNESISAQKINLTRGFYDQAQRYWLLYTQPELIRETLNGKIQDVSIGSKLQGYKIENLDNLNKAIVLSYSFSGPEYFTRAGNLRIMPQLASIDTSLVSRQSRNYPIYFGFLESRETKFEVDLPKELFVKFVPESINQDSPWLKFSATYKKENHKLIFRQKTELKKMMIPENEYMGFKNFLEKLAKDIKQRIVLERVN